MAADADAAETGRSSAVAPGALSRLLAELAAVGDREVASDEPALAPGDRVGRFEILREIGRGGFGAVYEAADPELGRCVALKTLRPGAHRRGLSPDALRREAEAVARLEHPSIVTLFDVGSWPGGGFLVMELLRGETLAQRLARKPLAVTEALTMAEEIASALAHAHGRGVLHRDLKPANVFLTEDGRVKLLDFGIAHLLGRGDESRGYGTPAYMAPEQLRGGPCDARADVYAAGLILAEMLGGSRPRASSASASGATIPLPSAVPRRLARVTAAALAPAAANRPRDGAAWLGALRDVRSAIDRRRRVRRGLLIAAAAATLGLLLVGAATWRVWRSRFPSGPVTVVVTDFVNQTGDPELEGISELVATSVRQSRKVRVMTRVALAEHLRGMGREPAERLDESLARELGRRVDARAVLLGSIRRLGEAYAIEVRGLDPEREQYAFTVAERGRGKDAVFELVDRAAISVRRALDEPDEEVRAADAKIGELVTRSLAAYQAYSEGLRCRERTLTGCMQHFQRAVAIDPTFAMAHYELAMAAFWGPDFKEQGLPAVRAAVQHVNRAPPSDQIKIRAFAAWAEGREADAMALYREAAARHPDDVFVLRRAAYFFITRDEPLEALPLQRRAVELAPVPGMGMLELADVLGALGRTGELAELEERAEAIVGAGGHPDALGALVVARKSLGDDAGAVDAARLALDRAATDGDREEARANLWLTRIHVGDLTVEPEIRPHCDYESTYELMTLLGLAGRRDEAFRVLETGARPECPARTADERREFGDKLFFHASLARFAAGVGDATRARGHARVALERNEALGPHLAVYLAYVGELETAEELARGLDPGSPRRRGYEAVALWRRGERDAARAMLRELEAQNAWSATPHVLPPSFLHGELCAELGDDAAAIASLERFGALFFYRIDFWSWAYPRSLYLLARSYERTGDLGRARERIARLLALWRSADPDLPLLAEARALGARLGVPADGTLRADGAG